MLFLPALSNVTPQGVAQSNVTLGVSLNSAKHKKAEALIRLDQCLLPVFESKLDASVPENHRAVHQLCPDLLIPLLKRQWLRFQVCDEQPDVSLLCDSQQLFLFLSFQLRAGCFQDFL